MAISQLVNECSQLFQEKEELMLQGEFDTDLTSLISSSDALKEIIALSIDEIYRSKPVLEKEVGGFEVIDHLIEAFASSMYAKYYDQSLPKHKSILRLIPEEFEVQLNEAESVYESLQVIIDFISGLTDSHAVRLYQIISGSRLAV